jgi:chromosome segregation protein
VVEQARAALSGALDRRAELEQAVADAERAHLAAVRAVADRREGLARLAGQVEALRSTSGATAEEIERLSTALAQARQRAVDAQREFDERQHEIGALHAGEAGLDERHEAALAAHATAAKRTAELTAAHQQAEQQRASWRARVEALSLGLARKDGSHTLLAAGLPGLWGSVAALLTVHPGAEAAVAAALGAAANALVVSDADVAAAAPVAVACSSAVHRPR